LTKSTVIGLINNQKVICYRFVFNPSLQAPEDAQAFRFLGILLGVAIRTKKPLDLHLAPIVWKLLAGEIIFCALLMTIMWTFKELSKDV